MSNFGADTALVSGCSLVGRAAVNLSTWTRQLLDFEVVDVSERMDLPLRSRGEGKAVCMNKYLVRQVANQYLIFYVGILCAEIIEVVLLSSSTGALIDVLSNLPTSSN